MTDSLKAWSSAFVQAHIGIAINVHWVACALPLICEEKGIPYGYVPSQEFLASEAGLPKGVKTASIAVMEINKSAQEKFNEIVEIINGLKA